MRPFDAGIAPLQRSIGRRREHHEQARGVGAVFVDQRLRVDAVVLGLGHLFHAADLHRLAVGFQRGGGHAALLVAHDVDVGRIDPVLAAVGFFAEEGVGHHHALCEQLPERFGALHQSLVTHQLVEEARVQQVQDGVFDAADILVDRQPVVGGGLVDHAGRALRRGIAGVVPGRLDEGVHGVGFAPGGAAAFRAGAFVERGHFRKRRAGAIGHHVFRQHHGQVFFRHWYVAAAGAMNDGDRAAPVALARDAPVAQAELGLAGTVLRGLEVGDDGVEGGSEIAAVVLAGIDREQALLVGVPVLPLRGGETVIAGGLAVHLPDRQRILVGKLEIAFVMCRHRHHRAFAIAPEHVVGDEHREPVAGERMHDELAGGHALFFHGGHVGLGHGTGLAFGDEGGEGRIAFRRTGGERMFGGHGDIGRAHQRIGTCRIHLELAGNADAGFVVVEHDVGAKALADPVALHGAHLLRPALELVEVVQQFFGVLGDAEVVHRDFALLDDGAGTPPAAVDHLFVGEHGLVDRVPVHGARFLVDHALLEQAREQPLFPAVVVRLAGGDFTRPVDGQTQRLELGLHVVDVGVGPRGRRHLVLHGGVFGRQAEGIPAHGLQHVLALHALVARDHVADGVVAHMAHVQLAGRIGEHRQAVELLAAVVFAGGEAAARFPLALGGGFDVLGGILFVQGRCHGGRRPEAAKVVENQRPVA